jgi:O-acetylhomoserine/O-acetylserine sulfhydrylase-like pyridoxal-dependent enzyme
MAEHGAEIFGGERPGYVYGRSKIPTQTILEERMASLEGAEAGMTHAIVSRQDRLKQGIGNGLLRLSIGLESVDDILDALTGAPDAL